MTNYDCCNCSCFFRFLDVFFAPCFVCVVSDIVRTIRHAQCILSVTRLTHLISYNTLRLSENISGDRPNKNGFKGILVNDYYHHPSHTLNLHMLNELTEKNGCLLAKRPLAS